MGERRKQQRKVVTRRDFLRGTAYGTLGVALGLKTVGCSAEATEKGALPVPDDKSALFAAENPTSTLVLIRDKAAVNADRWVNPKVVAAMVDTAVKTLAGEKSTDRAWAEYFRPDDTVGMKITVRVHTAQEIIDALSAGLRSVGIPRERIIVKDRDIRPHAKDFTALINATTIKAHYVTGVAAVLKNYINFDNNYLKYHPNSGVNLGSLWLRPEVKGKTRLVVVDALLPYFGRGDERNLSHRWPYKGIIVGTDPVAADAICVRLVQEMRNRYKGEEWLISPPPRSIAAADTKYKLGTSDPTKIKLIRLGSKEDILI